MKKYEFIVIILFIILVILFMRTNTYELLYVKSDIDEKHYLVRNIKNKQKASNLLARLKMNITILETHLIQNKDKYKKYVPYIEQLNKNIKFVEIYENIPSSLYTSYSLNKGEELVFCLRSKKYNEKLHPLNLMMYVTLHELAHVACPEKGHTELFDEIFSFIIDISIKLKLYNKIDFSSSPTEYCGMIISTHV